MDAGQQEDPERGGVAIDHVAVEAEALPAGQRTRELEVDVGVVLPVAQCVHKP